MVVERGVQRSDVHVIERRQCLHLTAKALRHLRRIRLIRPQNLHGLPALRDDVPHFIHDAESAGAELPYDFVIANCLSGFECHRSLSFQKQLLVW